MRLVSTRAQRVQSRTRCSHFAQGEYIITEYSHKYSVDEFHALARRAGFTPERSWVRRRRLVQRALPAHARVEAQRPRSRLTNRPPALSSRLHERRKVYPVPDGARRTRVDRRRDATKSLYRESVENTEEFWRKQAERLDWIKPFTQVKDTSFDAKDLHVRWFADGELNVVRELPRPASRETRRADRDPLGAGRSRTKTCG